MKLARSPASNRHSLVRLFVVDEEGARYAMVLVIDRLDQSGRLRPAMLRAKQNQFRREPGIGGSFAVSKTQASIVIVLEVSIEH